MNKYNSHYHTDCNNNNCDCNKNHCHSKCVTDVRLQNGAIAITTDCGETVSYSLNAVSPYTGETVSLNELFSQIKSEIENIAENQELLDTISENVVSTILEDEEFATSLAPKLVSVSEGNSLVIGDDGLIYENDAVF